MAKKQHTPLSPTLWRTCRALANRKRLRLLQYVILHPHVSVSVAARDQRAKLSATSQYLRALNARGLLQTKRRGREVLYEAVPDPSLPEARILLNALQKELGGKRDSIDSAFRILTAFTHPRRIVLIRAIAAGTDNLQDIRKKTGIPSNAALRHLRKLLERGYIVKTNETYRYRPPSKPLMRALTRLAFR